MTKQQEAMIRAQEALREGRHLLATLAVTLLGVYDEPGERTPIGRAIQEMQAAQDDISAALRESIAGHGTP